MNSWDYFTTLLGFDYALRFIENLLYTWPPPKKLIDYLSIKLSSTSIQLRYMYSGKEVNDIQQSLETVEPTRIYSGDFDSSRVTIVTKV